MGNFQLNLAKLFVPSNAELYVEIEEECGVAEYEYVWNESVENGDETPTRRDRWRMWLARKFLKNATEEEKDMVLQVSQSGAYLAYWIADPDTLMANHGHVRSPETRAENYHIFYEGFSDEVVIEPIEDSKNIDFNKAYETEIMENMSMIDGIFNQPEVGGSSLGENLDAKTIVTIVLVLGIMGVISVVVLMNAGVI